MPRPSPGAMRSGSGRARSGGRPSEAAAAETTTRAPRSSRCNARARSPTRCGGGRSPESERTPRLGRAGDDRLRVVMRLEVREHVVGEGASVAVLGPADADAEPQEILRSEGPRDRAQAVVSPEAAAAARLEPAEIEVALVVDDEDRVRLDLEEARCRRDRAARLVHVRLRLEQRDAMAVEPDLCQAAVELRAPRPAVPARELVHHHPAGIVA